MVGASSRLDELLTLLEATDEFDRIEAKEGSELGTSALETVSALSNEPSLSGGYLIFGLRPSDQGELFGKRYEIVGVPNPDKLQSDLATACAGAFSSVIRPVLSVETVQVSGATKAVVVAQIPEAHPSVKPVFIKRRGREKGSFRRIGGTDQHCTKEDFERFALEASGTSVDAVAQPQVPLSGLRGDLIARYRELVSQSRPEAEALRLDDVDLLYALNCSTKTDSTVVPTLAGLLLFGDWVELRRNAPMHRIDYIRVPGTEWVPDPSERYETLELLGPLLEIIPRAIRTVMDDIPKSFQIREGELQRRDVPRLPELAVRESIVNAVVHRDYLVHQPVQIIRYANRLEIQNPGYSLKDPDHLGGPGSRCRNAHVLAVLQETRWAEAKGTGIRAMRRVMDSAGLAPPLFESSRVRNEFVVRFSFHHFLNPEDWAWLSSFQDFGLDEQDLRALLLVRELGAIDNAAYRDLNHVDVLAASQKFRRLCASGLLEKKGKSVATYYVFGPEALRRLEEAARAGSRRPGLPQSGPLTTQFDPQTTQFDRETTHLDEMPGELREAVQSLGKRSSLETLQSLILTVCRWRPMGKKQLAELLGRGDAQYLYRRAIKPMLDDGRLRFRYPQVENHPQQAYLPTDRTGKS